MDDLISRKVLLEQIDQQRRASKTGFPKQSFVVGDAVNCIRNASAVEAKPVRHGRWVFDGLWEECSGCGYAISVDDKRTNYCPNCGAKMDLEAEHG